MAEDFKSMALVKLGIAGVLFLTNPFLGFWVGAAALMSAGLAGGMRLADVIRQSNFRRVKGIGLHFKSLRLTHTHNHARAYRRTSRPASAHTSTGDDSGDGGSESDSGDLPGPNFVFLVAQFQYFYRKLNSFLYLWCAICGFGCCRLPYRRTIKEVTL